MKIILNLALLFFILVYTEFIIVLRAHLLLAKIDIVFMGRCWPCSTMQFWELWVEVFSQTDDITNPPLHSGKAASFEWLDESSMQRRNLIYCIKKDRNIK